MISLPSKAFAIGISALLFCYCASPAQAQSPPDKLKEAVDYMLEKSVALCGAVPPNGSQQSYSIQGDIKAQLPGILKKLTDIGISGVGDYSEEHYEGVLQSQLADVMKDVIHCKENTFNLLFQIFLVPPRQSSLSSARFMMDRLEPKEDTNLKAMTLPVVFKNIGQSAARHIEALILPLFKPTAISAEEEEVYFASIKSNSSTTTFNVDIQPGQPASFIPVTEIPDDTWADFNNPSGTNKLLYLMSKLIYQSEDLPDNQRVVTETCLIFERGNLQQWRFCASGHNTTYRTD